jgi:hypothetical protein
MAPYMFVKKIRLLSGCNDASRVHKSAPVGGLVSVIMTKGRLPAETMGV